MAAGSMPRSSQVIIALGVMIVLTLVIMFSIDSGRTSIEREPTTLGKIRVRSTTAPQSDEKPVNARVEPYRFLLSQVAKADVVCATSKKLAAESKRADVSSTSRNCDVYLASDREDFFANALPRTRPGGYIIYSWSTYDPNQRGSMIFGSSRSEIERILEQHLVDEDVRISVGTTDYALWKKPDMLFRNPTLEAFLKDREDPIYDYRPRSEECYAFVITIPYNFGRDMAEEHMTAVYQLRKQDPTRDVVVFLILNTPPGAIEGRGWRDTTEAKWKADFMPQVETITKRFEKLGARVLVRPRMPQKPSDDGMYYQFDYQKIYVWNLRYKQVAFLDADMMIGDNPGSVFPLCGEHFCCAVQDPGAYGGYFNNGFFVMSPNVQVATELIQSWWKDNPPWRQICLQDIMNEVFARRWKALPENYNFQGLKHGHYAVACGATFIHFKDCSRRKEHPVCQRYFQQRDEAKSKFPEVFNF